MSMGLIGLLDDIAAIAKVAAASLDDVAAQATKAGAKAAAVVIDDAAVTPRYVLGFAASESCRSWAGLPRDHFATSFSFCFPPLWL